jgi:hypothetical protein
MPRDANRGDVFENIAYYGRLYKDWVLVDTSFLKELERCGFRIIIRENDGISKYNDYRNIDAVLAVRKFSRDDWTWKPATKLHNAWLAGVPAIVGPESAYRVERRSELDFVEVRSKDEIIKALECLRNDKKLRDRMVENGKVRAQEVTASKIVARWCTFFKEYAIPHYRQWHDSTLRRYVFITRKQTRFKTRIIWKGMAKFFEKVRIRIGLRTRIRKLFK